MLRGRCLRLLLFSPSLSRLPQSWCATNNLDPRLSLKRRTPFSRRGLFPSSSLCGGTGPIAIHHHYGAGTGREREGGLLLRLFSILPSFSPPLHLASSSRFGDLHSGVPSTPPSSPFLSSSSAEGGKWRAVWRGGRFKAEGPLPAGGGRPFFISFSQTRNCGGGGGGGGGLYRSGGLRAPSPCVQMASGREREEEEMRVRNYSGCNAEEKETHPPCAVWKSGGSR